MEQRYGNKAQVTVRTFDGIEYLLASDAAKWIGLPESWITDAIKEGGMETHVECLELLFQLMCTKILVNITFQKA